jgi:hypothetical protein
MSVQTLPSARVEAAQLQYGKSSLVGRYGWPAVALLALALCGCTDFGYYVKTDHSADVTAGVTPLSAADAGQQPLDVGVTFKSDGAVSATGSEFLFRTVREGLHAKGITQIHRIQTTGGDFTPEIVAAIPPLDGSAPVAAAAPGGGPRLLVLVENHPDQEMQTRVKYFLSGMSLGAFGLNKPTDRYDITILYRDASGGSHVFHNHQDLVFSSGSVVFGHDPQGVEGLKRYRSAYSAFAGVVDNSVNGTTEGIVNVGQPQFETPDAYSKGKKSPQQQDLVPGAAASPEQDQ